MTYQQNQPRHDSTANTQAPGGSPGLLVVAAVLGLGVAGALGYETIDLLRQIPDGIELPSGWNTMIVGHFVIAAIALIGVILVVARKVAGAVLLLAAGLLTVVAIALDPFVAEGVAASMNADLTDLSASSVNGVYFEALAAFPNSQATLRVVAGAAGVVLLVIAALPPLRNYLRGSRR